MLSTRPAIESDAGAIARIHNQGIAERIATFEVDPRSPEDVISQLRKKSGRFPTIVVEVDGSVIAWASAGPYRHRPCYQGIAEHSVYVDRDYRSRGAGLIALDALAGACEALGFWKLVSRV